MDLLPPPSTLPKGSTVWAYLRDSGGDNQDRSIARQLEVIQTYCTKHRLQLIHVYKDEAKSGTTTAGREDFLKMIDTSEQSQGNPTGLLLWSFSRFGRNADDAQYFKSRLRRNGIIIHSLTDHIPEGQYSRFVETLIDISNEERSRQTSIDAKDGLRSLVMQKAIGGTPPRGLKRSPILTVNSRTGEQRKRHKWIPDPKFTRRIRRAFKMRAAGASLKEIHESTQIFAGVNSYKFFFSNKLYIGILEFGDLVIEDYCDPIVDMDTWNAVQKHINDYSQQQYRKLHPRRISSNYLFSGFTVCARCGAPMNGNTVNRKDSAARDEGYRCSKSKRRAGCDAGRISGRKLEDLVLGTLTEFVLKPENIEAIQEIAIENHQQGETERQANIAERIQDRGKIARRIGNLTNAISEMGHSDALVKELRTLEADMVVIKKDLDRLEIPIQPVTRLTKPQIVAASALLIDRLNNGTLDERRQALRGIVESIRAERVGRKIYALITYYYPAPPFDHAPMLPMSVVPMGAQLYRQLFSYPAETK